MLTINNTLEGYLENVEIKGNTWQDSSNLADIRSVGDKVEGQELYKIPVLSYGKNLFNPNNLELIYKSSNEASSYEVIDNNTIIFNCPNSYNQIVVYIKMNTNGLSNIKGTGVAYALIDGIWEEVSMPIWVINDGSVSAGFSYNWKPITKLKIINLQIEEGKQATPYEPYREDKLTILSPTPLEKVGDMADRIICKDGVWGVEKNIKETTLQNSNIKVDNWNNSDDVKSCLFKAEDVYIVDIHNIGVISNKLKGDTYNNLYKKISSDSISTCGGYSFAIRVTNETLNGLTLKEYLDRNNIKVKYITTQPQFIPLPHDQQIKLRTFADRTNISFLTEIEGTLKAQVPKSLGATVNTHTTQIDNLNKELDRVKKLEESTVTTVTSGKAFTTVSETTSGYFEDVRVEGKTLVNCINTITKDLSKGVNTGTILLYKPNTVNSINTLVFKVSNINLDSQSSIEVLVRGYDVDGNFKPTSMDNILKVDKNGIACFKWEDTISFKQLLLGVGSSNKNNPSFTISDIMLLEGDHTDKDITFFEGLKSVGQDSNEISVSSTGIENVFNTLGIGHNEKEIYAFSKNESFKLFEKISPYIEYFKNVGSYANCNNLFDFYMPDNTSIWINLGSFDREEALMNLNYKIAEIEKKANKKQVLYFNPTTQTWEKPILREWDSIEKHSDGKYYYHKRSGEVVLNGSVAINTWINNPGDVVSGYFYHNVLKVPQGVKHGLLINDKLPNNRGGHISTVEGVIYTDYFALSVHKDRLGVTDVNNREETVPKFNQWLQANPVTVAYQLAQEEVYECTNLDLITYQDETNLIVNSGAIQPKITLKVLSNISNVVKLLQEKVSVLENNTSSYIVTQNRLQLASTYAADSVTFKVDYASAFDNRSVDGYNPDLYNLILSNILVGKYNYDYDKMFSIILDYASWDQISWEQFDELVLLMDIQHNPPIEIPEEDYTEEEIPEI